MGQRRYGLRDDQWKRIEGLLPGREETVGVTAKDNQLFVEAVLYRYRAGRFAGTVWPVEGGAHALHALVQEWCLGRGVQTSGR